MNDSSERAIRQMKTEAKAAARAQGCTCNVKIEVLSASEFNIRHDEWCPLLTAVRTQRSPQDQLLISLRPR